MPRGPPRQAQGWRHRASSGAGTGGLGLARAAVEAPLKAAELWPRDDAVAAGALADLVAAAYVRPTAAWTRAEWKPRTIAAHHKDVRARLTGDAVPREDRRRREQNAMRGGTRAFDAIPWREDLSIDNVEFDVAWRLVFGGVTTTMADRIDNPDHGFRWRGERMEWAFAQALHDCLPVTGEQPAPEMHPPDVLVDDAGDRADVDVLTTSGQRFVFDVRTVNVQCRAGLARHASPLRRTSATITASSIGASRPSSSPSRAPSQRLRPRR